MRPFLSRLLAVGLLLSGCAQERAADAKPSTSHYVAPALWRVADKDTTIYLFGTVHVMKPGTEWFTGGIKRAFDGSDELVLEIVEPEDPQVMAATMAGAALAKDGVNLSDRLTPEARSRYQEAMTSNGLPWQMFEGFNPWMAGIALSVQPLEKLGYKADLGAEKALSAAARSTGKKIGALETVEQQLGYFAGLPMDQQISFLNATVDGLPDMDKEFGRLITHWKEGDPEKLAAEMNESLEATPQLAKVLLLQRNGNWARWIKERLEQPGTAFVAVGAGHLAGKSSVQEQLKNLGIASARITE